MRLALFLLLNVLFLLDTQAAPPPFNLVEHLDSLVSPWIRQDLFLAQTIPGGEFVLASNLTLINNGGEPQLHLCWFQLPPTYLTLNSNGQVLRTFTTMGLGYRSFNTTLPDGNFIQNFEFWGIVGNCTGNVTFSVYKNPENISYCNTIIPLAEGSWKMTVTFTGCVYDPGEEFVKGVMLVYFDPTSSNFSTYRDSRGSIYKQSWTMGLPDGSWRRWDWNWQQSIISDGSVSSVIVDIVANQTEGLSYFMITVPAASYWVYDPDISVVLPPSGADGAGDGNLKIALGVILPISFVLAVLITITVITVVFVSIFLIKRRKNANLAKAVTRMNTVVESSASDRTG